MARKISPLVSGVFLGHRVAIARVISRVENRDLGTARLMREIFLRTGKARIIGITGPPGSGKSTLVDQLIGAYRERGKKVGVIAIDPSSPFSGGAILGDRIRMQRHHQDDGVYVRSLGTRGKLGGLSRATREAVQVLDAAGFDVILVETAGVGQTEFDVLQVAQSLIVVLVPESGDAIQVMKAGLMEIADLFVVNKSDRPEADKLVRELVQMVAMGEGSASGWTVPVLKTEAVRAVGVTQVVEALHAHESFLERSGQGRMRARRFIEEEVREICREHWNGALESYLGKRAGKRLMERVLEKALSPYDASDQVIKKTRIKAGQ